MTADTRYSGEIEVRYFLGADLIATRFETSAPLQDDVVTIDGREYLVEVRAVRINETTDQFEAFELRVRPLQRDRHSLPGKAV